MFAGSAASAPTVDKSAVKADKPAASVAWKKISRDEREVLRPLEKDWDQLPGTQQRRLIVAAKQYPKLLPIQQERFQERIKEWAALSPDQRKAPINRRCCVPGNWSQSFSSGLNTSRSSREIFFHATGAAGLSAFTADLSSVGALAAEPANTASSRKNAERYFNSPTLLPRNQNPDRGTRQLAIRQSTVWHRVRQYRRNHHLRRSEWQMQCSQRWR